MQKTIHISGMYSPNCASQIEQSLKKISGIQEAHVNFVHHKATILFDEIKIPFTKIEKTILKQGYGVIKEGEEEQANHSDQQQWKLRFFLTLLSSFFLYLLHSQIILLDIEFNTILQIFFATIALLCGSIFFVNAFRTLLPTADTLIALASGISYLYNISVAYLILDNKPGYGLADLSFLSTGLIFLFAILGKWAIQHLSTAQLNKRTSLPQEITILKEGKEMKIPIQKIVTGNFIIVQPQEILPADGTIIEGSSFVDETLINGTLVEKKKNDKVLAGSRNQTQKIIIKVESLGKETFLNKIADLKDQSQNKKNSLHTPSFLPQIPLFILLFAVLTFGYWMLTQNMHFALTPFLSVLLITTPSVFYLLAPSITFKSNAIASQKGILFTSSEILQNIKGIQTIIFEKTGVLTQGEPEVTEMHIVEGFLAKDVIKLAAIAEKKSSHPLAKAMLLVAKKAKEEIPEPEKWEALPGKGMKADYLHKRILVGSLTLMQEQGIPLTSLESEIEKLIVRGRTLVFVAVNQRILGLFGVSDPFRKDAKETIQALHALGKSVVLFTGDVQRTTEVLAKPLAIDELLCDATPEQKKNKIKELQQKGKVAIVALQKSPLLSEADLSIAFCTEGSLPSHDVILLKKELFGIVHLFHIGNSALTQLHYSFLFAFLYHVLALFLAAGILYPWTGWLLSPWIAALIMSIASFLFIWSSTHISSA